MINDPAEHTLHRRLSDRLTLYARVVGVSSTSEPLLSPCQLAMALFLQHLSIASFLVFANLITFSMLNGGLGGMRLDVLGTSLLCT